MHFSIEGCIEKLIFCQSFKPNQGVLYKDSPVWLDGARPPNSCILPKEHAQFIMEGTHPRDTFASIRKLEIFC
jgi:hypothetical protein